MKQDYVFEKLFDLKETLNKNNSDLYYDVIDDKLKQKNFLPRNLFDQFNIEILCTTESPLDDLKWHKQIIRSDWNGRVISAYRPDNVIDPESIEFAKNVEKFGEINSENSTSYSGYLSAHFKE